MRKMFLYLGMAALAAVPVVAHADSFDFAVAGSAGGFSGTGTLTATDLGGGAYLVTAISGPGITGLIAPGGFNGNDNYLYPNTNPLYQPGGSLVDDSGVSFMDTMGDTSFEVNLFSSTPSTSLFSALASSQAGSATSYTYSIFLRDSDGVTETLPVTFSITPTVPEPSGLLLLGTGALGLAGVARRRFARA